MFLIDAVTKFKFPLQIQLLEDLEDSNEGLLLNAGEIITVYGFGRQLVVTRSSGHVDDDSDSEEYVNMAPEKEVYIPENCCEKLKDIHCKGRIYDDIAIMKVELPRFLQAQKGFFALYADEEKGFAKIEKDQILEFVRINDPGNPGLYRNDNYSQSGKDLLIYKSNHEEINLTGEIISNLISIEDENEYSTKELLDNLSFPRKMLFVNTDLQEQFENLTNTPQQLILDLTDKPYLFFTSELQMPFTNTTTYRISLFENVNLLRFSVGLKNRIKVDIIKEAASRNGAFELLFAKENERKDQKQGNFKTFDIFGKFSREQSESDEAGTKTSMTSDDLDSTHDETESDHSDDRTHEETESDHSDDKEGNSEIKIPPLPNTGSHPPLPNTGSHPPLPNTGSHPPLPNTGSHPPLTSKKKLEGEPNYETIFPIGKNSKADNNNTALVTPAKSETTETETSIQHDKNVHKLHFSSQPEEQQPVFSDKDDMTKNQNSGQTSSNLHSNSVNEFQSKEREYKSGKIPRSFSVPVKNRSYVKADKTTDDKKDNSPNTLTQDNSIDITCNIKDMGRQKLYQCLKFCGLPAFADQCKQGSIDGSYVAEMEDEELTDEPYFLKKHELRKFHRIKEGWRPKE